MSDIDDILQADILDRISNISIVNGDTNDVSSLSGYLVHYANDLLDSTTALNFPAVAVQPLYDDATPNSSNTVSNSDRVMRVVGAVSVVDPSLVNKNINSLLLDVRKALAFNEYDDNRVSKAKSIEFGRANFNLPDSQDQYAFFEMDITIKYIDNWK